MTDRLIVALDVKSTAAATRLVEQLGDAVSFYKIGSELFTLAGPEVVKQLKRKGKRVFLDLKFHDIPNTVAQAVKAAAALEADLLTLHASGGSSMIKAAREAVENTGTRIVAVTVLTSLGVDEAEHVWGKEINSLREEIARLAQLAAEAGAHGVVASAHEAETVKRRQGADFLVITPGIRPAGAERDDQVRTATPAEAVRGGADFIVVGRPILEAPEPAAMAAQIQEELRQVTHS